MCRATKESLVGQLPMQILDVSEDSEFLQVVIRLGDQHSKWLGFFPQQAFRKSAQRGGLLGAINDEGKKLLGYVLWSVAKNRAVIQQLCVDDEFRKKGVGAALVKTLVRRTNHLEGISLHCARGFPAHAFWPRVGFIAIDEKAGRGKDQKRLTRYWYDHGHWDLLSDAASRRAINRTIAVLDANVFFEWHDDESESDDIRGLRGDWLEDVVHFCVTDEIFNEIDQNVDERKRDVRRAQARAFPKAVVNRKEYEKFLKSVAEAMPASKRRSDESDKRHLAWAAAAGAGFFITKDHGILMQANVVAKCIGCKVVSPMQFLLNSDQLCREVEYQPARLAGSSLVVGRVRGEDIERVAEQFLSTGTGERKSDFKRRLEDVVSSPVDVEVATVKGSDGNAVAFFALVVTGDGTVSVPFLRILPHPLGPTIARHLLMHAIRYSLSIHSPIVLLNDPHLATHVDECAHELGFLGNRNRWLKVNLYLYAPMAEIVDAVTAVEYRYTQFAAELRMLTQWLRSIDSSGLDAWNSSNAERLLYPCKLSDAPLLSFIVPVQPRWAKHLFDQDLATEDLFPCDPDIALRSENVYYRSAHIKILRPPGRILWYVSRGKEHPGPMSVRACSAVHEVVDDTPKNLFRRFRRLGVYQWKDLLETANGDHNCKIRAFRFGATEILDLPIGLRDLDRILRDHMGVEPPLSMPVKIPKDCFREIYTRGTGARLRRD